ncbi:hypothetical protein GTA08_BOTSDO02246 [Neofusicoccum parvum]|nr:hypothetical protein GTA08_BOTSDO02246 [Neofusicoccum parvum]
MASSLAMRRASPLVSSVRGASRRAGYQSLSTTTAAAACTPSSSLSRIPRPSSPRILGQCAAVGGTKAFGTAAPRQAEVPANMKRMMADMQKRRAMPSIKTMTMQNTDELPNDVGLLPETLVRPTGQNLPSFLSEPRLRLKLEKTWVVTRFKDLVSRLVYKWTTVKKPRPVINRRGIPKLALQLHKDMYTAFAYGDVEHLSRICTDGIFSSFRSRINARNPNERLFWTRLSSSRARIVSDRATSIPVPGVSTKERPCYIRQIVFRIKSRQALVKGYLRKGRNGTEKLLDAAGAELPVDETGEVTAERMQQESRDVAEYFVLQKRMWMGKEENWFVWGLVDETSVDSLGV